MSVAAESMDAVAIDHVVLEVHDPERSTAFYREVLDFEAVRLDEFRTGKARFPSVRVSAGMIVDLFPPTMWREGEPRNPNHLCFVGSREWLVELRGRLAARNIPIAHTDDHNFGARGFGRSIYFHDPDGVSIEVRHYEGDE